MTDILLVEDSRSLQAIYTQYLKKNDMNVMCVDKGLDAKKAISQTSPRLILLDLNLPDMRGEEIIAWVRDKKFPGDIIVMTEHSSIDKAVEVMRLGAADFLQKPFDANRLLTTIEHVIERRSLKNYVIDLKATFDRTDYHGFIGASLPMQAVYRIIDAAGPSDATVFITGQSGTGKEVCAQAIHQQSYRKDEPFIAINCGAIPKDLMESEIFGHVKGAFTGAVSERKGAALQADGGTLFLDEICEMDIDLQTKLLRFIQTGVVKKVGSSKEEKIDVRFICATNRDPLACVEKGIFREDLYYRLNVVPIHLPPLKDREGDLQLLAEYFLEKYSQKENKPFETFSPEVMARLSNYMWPGNIRQLQNVVHNIVVLHNDTVVKIDHLPPPLNTLTHLETPGYKAFEVEECGHEDVSFGLDDESLRERIRPLLMVERQAIENAIALCGNNIPRAARFLNVSPSTIYRKKQTWDK